jgi:hypothetical protein
VTPLIATDGVTGKTMVTLCAAIEREGWRNGPLLPITDIIEAYRMSKRRAGLSADHTPSLDIAALWRQSLDPRPGDEIDRPPLGLYRRR